MTPTDKLAFVGDPPFKAWQPEGDEVHVSCCFTWDLYECQRLASEWSRFYETVKIGGPATENCVGDFVAGMYVRSGVTITSRGCPWHCPWCHVPSRFGKVETLPIVPGNIIQDDNLLACPIEHQRDVFNMLLKQKQIKFSGGLDYRLMKSWHVKVFKSLRIKELWFACDYPDDWDLFRAKMALFHDFPRHKKRCYVLVGYDYEDIKDAEERCREVWEAGLVPFVQFYQEDGDRKSVGEWHNFIYIWNHPGIIKARMGAA